MLTSLYLFLGIYSACSAIAQQVSSTSSSASSSSIDLTANSILNAAITSSGSTASSSVATTFSTSFGTPSSSSSQTSQTSQTSSASSTSSITSSSILSSSSSSQSPSNVQSTSTSSAASVVPSATSEAVVDGSLSSPVSTQRLAIILGAIIGGIALLAMLLIMWCAFRRNSEKRRSYIRTDHPEGEAKSKRAMRSLTTRQLFSRGSGNAPEVLRRSGTPSTRSQNRTSSILQTSHPNTSEKALALGDIDEDPPLIEPLRGRPASTYRPTGDRSAAGPSSHYAPRSLDIMDVASSRYSSDGSIPSTYSPFQAAHPRASAEQKSPKSPQLAGRTSVNFHRPFQLPPDGLKSPEKRVSSSYFPARAQHRSQVALVHYPSWAALSENDSDHFDESDGQQGSRERPSVALSRRSGNWKSSSPKPGSNTSREALA